MLSRVCCVVAALVVLVGCGSDGEPSGDGSSATGEPTSSAASGSPTESANPSVVPADGKQIDAGGFTYRLPPGRWHLGRGGLSAGMMDDESFQRWHIDVAWHPTSSDDLEREAQISLDNQSLGVPVTRAENRTVGGVEGYVIEGSDRELFLYEFGALHDGHTAVMRFVFPADFADAEEWVESVLASVEWK